MPKQSAHSESERQLKGERLQCGGGRPRRRTSSTRGAGSIREAGGPKEERPRQCLGLPPSDDVRCHRTSCFYLTAFADRFLVGSKESIMTPQGGLGGIRGFRRRLPAAPKSLGTSSQNRSWRCQNSIPGLHFGCPEPTVGHFVVFEFPELHSRATFWMPGANCKPLRGLRVPRTPFPGHILNARSQL